MSQLNLAVTAGGNVRSVYGSVVASCYSEVSLVWISIALLKKNQDNRSKPTASISQLLLRSLTFSTRKTNVKFNIDVN